MVKNKVIVVLGGCGLIGSVLSKKLYNYENSVIIGDLNIDKCPETFKDKTQEIKGSIDLLELNITDSNSLRQFIDYVENKYKRIDAVVNSTYPKGTGYGRKLEEVTYETFCETVNLHLGGYFLAMKEFALFFKKQGNGNFINISSVYGVIPPRFEIYNETSMTMPIEYAAIKAAIIHLTRYMAKYFKGCNIRFNCVSPGGIYHNQQDKFLKRYKNYCLNKGMLEVEDIVGAILFLLSDDSKFINGQNIIVDDGFSL